ncbi:exodeoxyribonuclease VII large subunit [bacterium]|nr:exodeoxyribonuclease VII large subunit [bacterium]
MPASPHQVLSVSELTRRIKGLLEDQFPGVWVEGEISNLRTPASGHVYFTLKDATAQLAAVAFRGVAARLTFRLQDGLAVIAGGDLGVYERQGQYQIVVRQLLPKGLGASQLAFEELKRKLQAEGLFESSRKKPLPALPQQIGVVTSPTGAAIRDFLKVLGRRFPNVRVVINPVRVQGDGAAAEIAAAIDQFNALQAAGRLRLDVLVLTRGGGSLEDLWAFNEEIVARAIARSSLPTISAVGHEIDFTIADFVADLRAPTPSAAAELVVKAKDELVSTLTQYRRRLTQELRLRVAGLRQRYTALAASYVFRQPTELVRQQQQRVDDQAERLRAVVADRLADGQARLELATAKFRLLSPRTTLAQRRQRLGTSRERLDGVLRRHLDRHRHRWEQTRTKLDLLSPRTILQRGYSITRLADSTRVVRRVSDVRPGHRVRTRVLDGEFDSVVD